MVVAVALSIAVTICSVDHVGAMHGASEHAHGAPAGCLPDVCITAIAQNPSLSGMPIGFVVALGVPLDAGLNPRLVDADSSTRALLLSTNHFPRASNKLYRLHAAYRL
jgi:hypothetical protein